MRSSWRGPAAVDSWSTAVPIRTDSWSSSIGGASDHASFQRAGIEVGGVFTGASERVGAAEAKRFGARSGQPADPCYHRACDTLGNIDRPMVARVADAVEAAVRSLAG